MVRQNLVGYRTAWRGTIAGLLVGLALSAVFAGRLLIGPYTALQDRLFPAPPPAPGITLVAIDSSSETDFLTPTAQGWPFSNEYHAQVINKLAAHHPAVLMLDIVFDHATGLHCTSEQLSAQFAGDPIGLEQACLHAPGSPLVDSDGALVRAIQNARELGVPVGLACTADNQPLPEFADAATSTAIVGARGFVADRSLGLPDPANAVRTVPLKPAQTCGAFNTSGEAAFLQVARTVNGDREPLTFEPGRARIGSMVIPLTPVPDDPRGQMIVNFSVANRPPPGAVPCTYAVAYQSGCTDAQVRGKIVVVGVKVVNADDIHAQPVAFDHDPSFCPAKTQRQCMADNENYGYRIMADEIGTVLQQRYLKVQPDLSILLAILVISALTGTIAYLLPLRVGSVAMLIGLVAYVGAAVLFGQSGYLVDPLFAPAAIVLASALALAARYLIEERERRKLEAIFGQYVDPNVMGELVALDSADQLKVGGERRELSVLFIDVRGFTTASEKMDATEVVAALNDFTERCTRIVFEHRGTVDKYIGDCVMAFWNAPKPCADHADQAVDAALHMIESQPASGPLSGVGIGIYTGEVVVGNVGGATRKQYTAIGDVVNTASRLCSAAPAGAILVGGPTWEQLTVKPPADRLEPLRVKGRGAAVAVYSITRRVPVRT
jgi:class 3 adenylate cyclase/CHASE2 domain-containing sensor protein